MNFVMEKYRPRHALVVTFCSVGKADKQSGEKELFDFHLHYFSDMIVVESARPPRWHPFPVHLCMRKQT